GNKQFEQNISIIKCKYGGDDCNPLYPAIYYNRTWWIYIDTTRRWVNASREGIPIPSTELRFTDMDGNNAPELLILHKRDKRDSNYYVLDTENSRRFEYAINFSRYASIKENTTLVSVFLKVVIGFSNSSEFSASIRIILAKSENPSLTISNYATLLSTKIPRSDLNMTIYEGYVMFPVRQFDYFNSIIYNNPGIYDVIVEVYVETQGNVEAAAGIEYIAVTSYSY
ncbi:MAG: hypothetical protein N3G48_07760, partial [Sulfolobales archaeon]|nr:hypothetical protein [Sulfolobales archaeon]